MTTEWRAGPRTTAWDRLWERIFDEVIDIPATGSDMQTDDMRSGKGNKGI